MDIILLPLLNVLMTFLNFYSWIVIIYVIMSWLMTFGVVNPTNQFVGMVIHFLRVMTEPVLDRLRQFLPRLGGIDLSPLVLLLLITFLSNVLVRVAIKFA